GVIEVVAAEAVERGVMHGPGQFRPLPRGLRQHQLRLQPPGYPHVLPQFRIAGQQVLVPPADRGGALGDDAAEALAAPAHAGAGTGPGCTRWRTAKPTGVRIVPGGGGEYRRRVIVLELVLTRGIVSFMRVGCGVPRVSRKVPPPMPQLIRQVAAVAIRDGLVC